MFDSVSSTLANIVGWLIQKIFESIVAPFADIYKVDELIFGTFKSDETIYWRTFTESELANAFLPTYYLMMTVAGTMLVLFIIFAGMRIAGASISANKRNELMEFTKELVLVGMGLFLLPQLYSFVFAINNMFVDLFSSAIGTDIFAANQDITGDDTLSSDTGLIGKVLINFILIGVGIWANFYYLVRKITLLILLPLGPVMLVCWMFPAWKGVTLTWIKETVGTIFIQSIHAFTFWIVASISNAETGLIATIIGYMIFIPISEQVKSLLGLSTNMQGGLNKAGSMMGMAAIAGVAGSLKGAMSGDSVMGALKGLKDGGKKLAGDLKEGKGLGESLKDLAGTAKEAAFSSAKSMDMEKFGDLVSKGGKAVGGVAGTFIGSPMGPIAALAGAEGLSKLGGATAGLGGRTGFAAASKLKGMFKDGSDAVNKAKNNDNEANITDAISTAQAAEWAEGSKAQIMQGLREKFPTATEQELGKKFNNIVAQKAKSYANDAKDLLADAKNVASEKGDAEQLIHNGANAMADTWAQKNGSNFIASWKSKNPQGAKESNTAYEKRAQGALANEKSNMFDNFKKDGEVFARDNADTNGHVNRGELANFMSNSAMQHKGIGNVNAADLMDSAKSSMANIQGISLLGAKGQPDMNAIVANLATAKTNSDRKTRIDALTGEGMSPEQAEVVWRGESATKHAENLAHFSAPEFGNQIGQRAELGKMSGIARGGQTVATFVQGAVAKDAQAIGTSLNALKETVTAGASTMQASMSQGNGVFESARLAKNAAQQTLSNKILDNYGGDAVQAQQSIVQGAGYAAGILGGATGRVMAQSAALKVLHGSNMNQAVQSQISNASEIIQMAHKVPDENGNMQVAPGAIRQVTTRDKSFIEVRTASGEIQTVSRIGAGSESLKQGETVYQDLTSSDGKSLDIAKVGRSQVSTYRMDTSNGRIPVDHAVQNPMSLIGNTGVSHVEANQGYRAMPVLSQKVDAGQFFKEDLGKAVTSGQFSNVEVVTSKGEQYLAGLNNEGQKVRLSPITQGDARLGANQVVSTPVQVSPKGIITAAKTAMNSNGNLAGVGSTVVTTEQIQGDVAIMESAVSNSGQPMQRQTIQRNVVISNPNANGATVTNVNRVLAPGTADSEVFVLPQNLAQEGTATFNNLLNSKNDERIQRGLNKRAVAEQIRFKQGRP